LDRSEAGDEGHKALPGGEMLASNESGGNLGTDRQQWSATRVHRKRSPVWRGSVEAVTQLTAVSLCPGSAAHGLGLVCATFPFC